MYKYTFILNNGQQDHIVGDMFRNVLTDYFQWRAVDLLSGVMLEGIEIRGYPKSKGKAYHVDKGLIKQIVSTLKQQNSELVTPHPLPAKTVNIYKGVNLDNFADDTIITLDGSGKDYEILRSWFPDDIKNKKQLQITKESIYSLTLKDAAEKLTQSIKTVFPEDLANLTITDATANVGGNTLNFAKHFAKVNAVEIDELAFEALENNIKIAGYTNVQVIHGDYLKVMNTLSQDVIFFDPPWGGLEYWKEEALMLKLDDKPIYKVINDLVTKPKLVVIKAPKNFALAAFEQKVDSDHVWSYPYYNHQIVFVRFEDLQKERCEDMKKTCPEGSREHDPIMYEDWCDDVPYQEFVKNDEYLSQCYRLSNLINAFKAGLEATKNEAPMPQWPVDPVSGVGVSVETLQTLYKQAQDAQLEIPELFVTFMNALESGLFDVEAAMKGQYIGKTDQISLEYRKGFVEPAVDILFPTQKTLPPLTQEEQEEKDLQMAIQLSEQIG